MDNTTQTTERMSLHGGEILSVIVICLLFLGSSFVYATQQATAPVAQVPQEQMLVASVAAAKLIPPEQNPFTALALTARAAIVYDVHKDTILYQKNSDLILPLASLTKTMTALTVYKLLPPQTAITIKKDFLASDQDPQLTNNETWTMKNLLDYTMTISSNDGAVSLAAAAGAYKDHTTLEQGRSAFITEMNTLAQEIGLTQTTFYNESGLDQDMTTPGAYGSAQDMVTLFKYILENYPEILEGTRYPTFETYSEDHFSRRAVNTNTILDKIPGIIGSKTGYTDLAGGNLIIAYDAGFNKPIISIVLGSTYTGRFDDMLALVSATNTYLALQNRE